MIYNFRIVSDEVANFKREIQIDADATFLELRNAICESVGYDKTQLSSFLICDNNWEREQEISLEDMGTDSSQEVYLMEDTPIVDFITDEGQRMMWVYDYMTERAFFIELKSAVPGKHLRDPLCSIAVGEAPAQFVEPDLDFKIDTTPATDLDDDFYGSTDYNDDEYDSSGYGEMSLDEQ
ncbi:MAG: hypothetical protein J1E29_04000 [Duncaniella sp.]|nr:hypothetical protein [Duncaniella sp.]